MNPILFTIYGPLHIHFYGLCIGIGICLAFYGAYKTMVIEQKIITTDQLYSLIFALFLGSFVGGKILYLAELFMAHELPVLCLGDVMGGFSVLGSIIGALGVLLYKHRALSLSFLQLTDELAPWALITQSWGRLGCLCAGCCHGLQTTCTLSVTYTHHNSLAHWLNIPLHPTQLYSSVSLLLLFILIVIVQRILPKNNTQKNYGYITAIYLFGVGCERFFMDYLRADTSYFTSQPFSLCTLQQCISAAIMISALALIAVLYFKSSRKQ